MLAVQLAIDVSFGEPFLGSLDAAPGRVLYIDYENRAHRLKERALSLAPGRALDDIYFAVYDRISQRDLGLDGDPYTRLFEEVRALKPALLIIDPLDLATSIWLTDQHAVVALVERCSRLQEASPNLAVLLVHHLRKAQTSKLRLYADPRAWVESAFGSQALIAHVDTIIGLEQDSEGHYTLATVPRSFDPLLMDLRKNLPSERLMLAESSTRISAWPTSLHHYWHQLPDEFTWTQAAAIIGNSNLGRLVRRAKPALLTQDKETKIYRKLTPRH
jgi:hypothetical protein